MGWVTFPCSHFDTSGEGFDYASFEAITASATDGITISDSKIVSILVIRADGIKLADCFNRVWDVKKELSDGVTLADSKVGAFSKVLSDGVRLSDVLTKVWSIKRTFTDGIKLADYRGDNVIRWVKRALISSGFVIQEIAATTWSKISALTSGFTKKTPDSTSWTKSTGGPCDWSKPNKKIGIDP